MIGAGLIGVFCGVGAVCSAFLISRLEANVPNGSHK